jgi:hypothetical protein
MTTQMMLVDGPLTLTEPTSNTRNYFISVENLVDDQIAVIAAYSDPYEGTVAQPVTYVGYTVSLTGAVTASSIYDSWMDSPPPEAVPGVSLAYGLKTFNSLNSDSVFGEYFINQTVSGGQATYDVAVVNISSGTPIVTQVGSLKLTPIGTTGDDLTAKIANLAQNNSLNEQLFEAASTPGSGQIAGEFLIYNSSGAVVVGQRTGFSFSDNKAHFFSDFGWDANDFGELVEVWNSNTGLADVQLSLINATTGAVTAGWTAATEMKSVTYIVNQRINPAGSGMIIDVDGTNVDGNRGFSLYLVNDSTASSGGAGGQIIKSESHDYSGTLTQDARVFQSGIANENILYWADGTGLNIELIDANLNVLETYNIAASVANGSASVTSMGNGEIFVSYRTVSGSSAVDSFDILNLQQTAGLPVNSGNNDEWILSGGNWEASAQPGSIPSGYNVAGVGDFTGDGTSGILWYNPSTGDAQQWLINNGAWAGTVDFGSHPGNFQIAGVGDFNGDGIDGVLWTGVNSNGTVATDIWELSSSGQWMASVSPGSHPAGYQVVGVGDFTGNGTSDILWYNSATGDVDEWQLANGQWSASVDLGTHPGSGWTIAGVGDFFGNGNEDVLWTNSSSSGVQTDIWQLGPNGQWETSVSPGTHPAGYQVAGIADVTGASVSDIIWYNPSTGDVDEWKIANGQWAGSVDLGTHPGNFQIAGMGDFTGDGTNGILWHSTS